MRVMHSPLSGNDMKVQFNCSCRYSSCNGAHVCTGEGAEVLVSSEYFQLVASVFLL